MPAAPRVSKSVGARTRTPRAPLSLRPQGPPPPEPRAPLVCGSQWGSPSLAPACCPGGPRIVARGVPPGPGGTGPPRDRRRAPRRGRDVKGWDRGGPCLGEPGMDSHRARRAGSGRDAPQRRGGEELPRPGAASPAGAGLVSSPAARPRTGRLAAQ